jgi:hypothetical protein
MQCIVRKSYAYYWQGRTREGGEVVDISEDEYKKQHWIFEPLEHTAKVLNKSKTIPLQPLEDAKSTEQAAGEEKEEPIVEESENETKTVEEDLVNNRAIVDSKEVKVKSNKRRTRQGS